MKYDEQSIKVLKGLEPVRARPGMYTRTDSPLHIIQEMIDNAADEALAGSAKHVDVMMHADGSISVADDGRGIPVGPHPVEKAPTVEIVFTRLHAGGKFDKKGGGAYAFSGGLHGVGVSVTNALSKRLEVTVKREGATWEIAFAGGETSSKLKKTGKAGPRESGTVVRAWPDPKYFDTATVKKQDLELAAARQGRAAARPRSHAHGRGEEGQARLALRRWLERVPAGTPRRRRRLHESRVRRFIACRRPTTSNSPRAKAPSGRSRGPKPAAKANRS